MVLNLSQYRLNSGCTLELLRELKNKQTKQNTFAQHHPWEILVQLLWGGITDSGIVFEAVR